MVTGILQIVPLYGDIRNKNKSGDSDGEIRRCCFTLYYRKTKYEDIKYSKNSIIFSKKGVF